MKIDTNELIGVALDWAVGYASGERDLEVWRGRLHTFETKHNCDGFAPSQDWGQAGYIVEYYIASLVHTNGGWVAQGNLIRLLEDSPDLDLDEARTAVGPTPLVAAMRCYVANKLGNSVDVPDGILEACDHDRTRWHTETIFYAGRLYNGPWD